jgi:hypothetical protein
VREEEDRSEIPDLETGCTTRVDLTGAPGAASRK